MGASLSAPAAVARSGEMSRQGVKSAEGRRLVLDLLDAPPAVRREAMRESVKPKEWPFLLREVLRETGSMYGLWHDTPSGFTEDVCGETVWAKQQEVLDAVPGHKRIAVPAGFGVGKTHLAGRAVAWFVCVNPPGTALAVTTATRYRQVVYQLWPHIRKVVARAGLPGNTDLTQWKMPDQYGNDVVVAYGFTAPPNDEAAMQGIHAPRLLLVVDEAGGIARTVGSGTNNLLTGDARMLAIGNPPTDDPRSWFETLCEEGNDGEEPGTCTISIAAVDSPAITGEPTPLCRDCPEGVPPHRLAVHLPDQAWVDRTIGEYGEDHPYVIAKVYAQFPKGSGNKTIPVSWVEGAQQVEDPTGDGYVRLCDLDLDGETEKHTVKRGAWVRLGVDVAADGGDELAIYRAVGDMVHQRHVSAGSINANAVNVAERVLEHIDAAQRLASALGCKRKVRVKIDTIGVGWGVVSMLERWAGRRHHAEIVAVNVAENVEPERDDEGAVMRPWKKRDDLWLSGRALAQPDPSTGEGRLRLRVDRKAGVQLTLPNLDSRGGFSVVESKKSLRARGLSSPDRAEAALLAVYEPFPLNRSKRLGLLV